MLAAQPDKSILNVYNFQKVHLWSISALYIYSFLLQDQINLKIVLPEKLSCLVVDTRGDFCAGGTAQGRIYLWEVRICFGFFQLNFHNLSKLATGILFNSWDAHYRKVNLVKFTNDGAALISGSDDSGVSVWSVSRSIGPLRYLISIIYLTYPQIAR